MVHPRFLSRASLLLCVGLAFCFTGCQDQEKLAAQTKEVLQKVEELKALKGETSGSPSPKKHPLARKGTKALQTAITTLEGDVIMLQERKTNLEAELATLEKDAAAYRVKNL